MILAELARRVTERLKQLSDRRVFLLKADVGAGHAHFRQACPNRVLTSDKTRTSGSAALLRIVIGECDPFFRHAVNIRCAVAHHAATEVTDVPDTDVISPQN